MPTVGSWPIDQIPEGTLTPTPENTVSEEVQRAFTLASHAFDRGDLETALVHLDAALALAPANAGCLSLRGQVHVALLHPLQGEADLQAALSVDPFQKDARRTLAELYADYNQWREATAEYRRYLILAPADAHTWFVLGQLLERQYQPVAAIEAYSATLELEPTHIDALSRRGNLYLQAEDYEAAWPDYSALIQLAPSVELYQTRAEIGLGLNAPLLAAADFQQAILLTESAGDSPYPLMIQLGKAYLAADVPLQAAATFSESVGLSKRLEPRLLLGESYLQAQAYATALQVYSNTLPLAGPWEGSSVHLGQGRAYLGLGELETALAEFEQAITTATLIEERASALRWQSEVYLILGQVEEAVVNLTLAHELTEDPIYLYWRGLAYQAAEDFAAAEADLTAFVQDADPKLVEPAWLEDAQARLAALSP